MEAACRLKIFIPKYTASHPDDKFSSDIVDALRRYSYVFIIAHNYMVKYFSINKPIPGVGIRPFACWDCGFESLRRHGCVSCECCVLSGSLCVGLITRPEEF